MNIELNWQFHWRRINNSSNEHAIVGVLSSHSLELLAKYSKPCYTLIRLQTSTASEVVVLSLRVKDQIYTEPAKFVLDCKEETRRNSPKERHVAENVLKDRELYLLWKLMLLLYLIALKL